jgi:hypothetical protein
VFGKQDGQLRREARLRRIGLIQSIQSNNRDRDDATWHGTSHITCVEDRDGRQTRRRRSNGDVDWLFFVLGQRNLTY